MKIHPQIIAVAVLCLNLVPARAQLGPTPSGPDFVGPIGKLFGSNQAFSGDLEFRTIDSSSNLTVVPGKLNFDSGKSRFDISMADVQNKQIPAAASALMKSMDLDQMVIVARPDKKVAYLVYPGMKSYVETGLSEIGSAETNGDYKVETTELGKEIVDSHACVKNKVVVTGKDGDKQEFTAWNAADLKKFPVKIQTADATMLFKNVSLSKPAASLFEAPAGYTKYDDLQTMLQRQLIKRMSGADGGFGLPPAK